MKQNPFLAAAFMAFTVLITASLTGCASLGGSQEVYKDPNMDFGAIRSVAVLPFNNLSKDSNAAERVRDVFLTRLLATGALYVLPEGEVNRGLIRAGITSLATLSTEDIQKLGGVLKVNAVITGVLREYGEVRSGSSTADIISLSLQMIDVESGKVIWSAASTKGGVTTMDRLFGGGGNPMNSITQKAVSDLLADLFK